MDVSDTGQTVTEESFDLDDFAAELEAAPLNHEIGTRLCFENDHVRIFDVTLEPGQRGPFHIHDRTYFWTVVEPGLGRQRFVDGSMVTRTYVMGETKYLVHTPSDPLIHDLENVGDTTLRFMTVELKH